MEFTIKQYLKKFEKFLPFESQVKNIVIDAVLESIGITLERSKISISGDKVFITGSSSLKSEIRLKQEKILKKMKELQPKITITKII